MMHGGSRVRLAMCWSNMYRVCIIPTIQHTYYNMTKSTTGSRLCAIMKQFEATARHGSNLPHVTCVGRSFSVPAPSVACLREQNHLYIMKILITAKCQADK